MRILIAVTAAACGLLSVRAAADMSKLVKENNAKAGALMQQITRTYGGLPRERPGTIGSPKDLDALRKAAAELEKLVALKDGAPTVCDAAKIRWLMARAYSEPRNLRLTKEARAEFRKALEGVTKPDDRAQYAYDYATFEYDVAEDDAPEKWEAAQRAAYGTPGVSVPKKLDLLERGVPGCDYEKTAWPLVKDGAPELRMRFYRRLLRHTDRNDPSHSLDRTNTPEYWLSVCDRAIADLGPKAAGEFASRRQDCLRQLGRGDEVERELKAVFDTSTVRVERVNAASALGAHYRAMAQRYYAEPDPGLMKKAVDAYAFAAGPGNASRELVETMMEAKMYREVVDRFAAKVDLVKPDRWTAAPVADAYYYLGDYENAVRIYDAFGKNLHPGERNPPNRFDRHVESLYAVGRYEDCLKAVDRMNDWRIWKARKEAYRQRLREKLAEQKGADAK